MEAEEIMKGMTQKNRDLAEKNKDFLDLYKKHAEAERIFNINYATKLTELRMQGEPITLAKDLAKGDKVIAGLFYDVKIAEGVLNACRERIKDLRSGLETYRSFLSWEKAKMGLI